MRLPIRPIVPELGGMVGGGTASGDLSELSPGERREPRGDVLY